MTATLPARRHRRAARTHLPLALLAGAAFALTGCARTVVLTNTSETQSLDLTSDSADGWHYKKTLGPKESTELRIPIGESLVFPDARVTIY